MTQRSFYKNEREHMHDVVRIYAKEYRDLADVADYIAALEQVAQTAFQVWQRLPPRQSAQEESVALCDALQVVNFMGSVERH